MKTAQSRKYSLVRLVAGLFGVRLYPFQERFLFDCLNSPRVAGVWSRQTGKSMTLAIYVTLEAQRMPDGHIVIVAPTDRQAGELFVKISSFIQSSKFMENVQGISKREVVFRNGARISAYPCGDNGETIRGLTANVLIMEEAAYIKDSIVNEVLTPMCASTNGRMIKISTPFSIGHFYRSAFDGSWAVHRITYRDALAVGHYTQEFVDEQKRTLGETSTEFRTEYGAEFVEDEDAYFKPEAIQNAIEDYPMIEVQYG